MAEIINVPKRNNFFLKAVRGLIEHRATWLYLLLKEGEKRGIPWEDIGFPAIRACGNIHGRELARAGEKGLIDLRERLFTKPAQWVFQMKILESTRNKLSIDFGYCPLVAAWQKLGCTGEEIRRLCDIAMAGDRGIAESFGGKLEIGETLAKGDKACQIRFTL